MSANNSQVNFRLPDDVLKRVNDHIEKLERTTKLKFTRANAVLSLINMGLDAAESEGKRK